MAVTAGDALIKHAFISSAHNCLIYSVKLCHAVWLNMNALFG